MRFRILKALHLTGHLAPQSAPIKQVSVTQPTPLPEEHRTERRQSPRRGGPPLEVFIGHGDDPVSAKGGWVKNRSARGLGLSVAEPIADGTQLQVRPTLAPEGTPWVRVEVKNCRPLLGRWMLGCQFIDPVPEEVLALFG